MDRDDEKRTSDSTGYDIGRRGFMGGAALALTLAGTSMEAVAEEHSPSLMAKLLEDKPKEWDRFDEDDELGRLNLLGSEQAFDGMRAATKGGRKGIERFTLQLSQTGEVITPDPEKPTELFPSDSNDVEWPSTDTGDPAFPPRTPGRRDNVTPDEPAPAAGGMKFADDKFVSDMFLQGTTHLDALGHAWYGDEVYNGFSASETAKEKDFDTPLLGTQGRDSVPDNGDPEDLTEVSTTKGLDKVGVENVAGRGIAGRAVLLDVGRALDGVSDEHDRLPMHYGITYDDLMETAQKQGTKLRERDIVLIRTGSIERTRDPNAEWAPLTEPGIVYSDDMFDFFYENDVPYVGADNLAVEKVVQSISIDGTEEPFVIPLHGVLLRNLGVYINEILDLRELSAACAEDGIYEFLFTAAPLEVERATGAPINPVVLKASRSRNGR